MLSFYKIKMDRFKENLMKRLNNVHLYPFYGTVVLYFILFQPFWNYPEPSFLAALCKVLPIWALAYFVRQASGVTSSDIFPTADYSKFIMLGLLISSIGDAFLVIRYSLFIPGMLAFAVAHCSYLYAMDNTCSKDSTKSLYFLGALASFLFVSEGIDNCILQLLVFIYTCLLFTVGWRARCRYESLKTFSSLLGCVGVLLFMFSDFVIASDKWRIPVPFTEFIVMTTYYTAQFFIALSTEKPE